MKAGAVIRGLLAGALAFAAVWLVAILYWRSTGATPTTGQILGYLLLMPLLLIGVFLLVRMLIRRRKARRAAGGLAPTVDGESTPDSTDATEPDRVLHLLASAVVTRAGNAGDAVAQALLAPERPSLHPGLRDQMGLPVFAAQVDDLDVAHVRASLAGLLPEPRPRTSAFGEDQLRALALLEPVAEDLFLAALPDPVDTAAEPAVDADIGTLHPHAMHHSRSSRAAAPALAAPVLHIRLLLPSAWPEPVRRACAAWLGDKALAIGFAGGMFRVGVEPVAGAADVWRVLDRLAQTDGREDAAGVDTHLLLAAHSLVDERAVDRLDAARTLLVSGNPEGLIPGEGAAGVWVSTAAPPGDLRTPPLRLHRMVHGPAGQGRAAGRALATLMQRALAIAGLPLEQVGAVFSDADHRPSRAIEIASAITAALPDLDPVEQGRHLGIACGETGAVATLAVLAAAAAQAGADGRPVLLASVADREVRFAGLLSPLPNPEPSVASAAGKAA